MKKLICKDTGETSYATDAGAERLLKRGTHELADKPKKAPASKKASAAKYEGGKQAAEE